MPPSESTCRCQAIQFDPSPFASQAGFCMQTESQRHNATRTSTRKDTQGIPILSSTFPAPLVLPGDDLALDPKYPPQSLRAWVREKDRNEVTPERGVVYVAFPPPGLSKASDINGWARPFGDSRPHKRHTTAHATAVQSCSGNAPRPQDVIDYLSAFYHGMPVKTLAKSRSLSFVDWSEDNSPPLRAKAKRSIPKFIGFSDGQECVRVRVRSTPSNPYPCQLNLDDLLDAAIDMLPTDAYALLLLVAHDLYEDEDDDFACGRAYGGSRVAVVSMARYNPELDEEQSVDRAHSWPASHCRAYVSSLCQEATQSLKTSQKRKRSGPSPKLNHPGTDLHSDVSKPPSPLAAAIASYRSVSLPGQAMSSSQLSGLWLGRVCRTASHELGHCFGLDHCVYYACSMQGTSCLAEDARQPPYLCPVDLAKLLQATGAKERDRYRSLLDFCQRFPDTHLFTAFGAWLVGRMGESPVVKTSES